MTLTALFLPAWFSWCWFDFGLFWADSDSEPFDDEVGDSRDYKSVHDDMCDEAHKFVVDRACLNFCDSFKDIWTAGIVMLIFISLAIISLVANIAILIFEIAKKKAGSYAT